MHGMSELEVTVGVGAPSIADVVAVARDGARVRGAVERGAGLVRGDAVPDQVQRLVAGQQLVVPRAQTS